MSTAIEIFRCSFDEIVAEVERLERENAKLWREKERLARENNILLDELHNRKQLQEAAEEAVGELQAMNERAQGVTS